MADRRAEGERAIKEIAKIQLAATKHSFAFHLAVLLIAAALPLVAMIGLLTFRSISSERLRLETAASEASSELAQAADHDLMRVVSTLKDLALTVTLNLRDLTPVRREAEEVAAAQAGDILMLDEAGHDVLGAAPLPLPLSQEFRQALAMRLSGAAAPEISDLLPEHLGQGRRVVAALPVRTAAAQRYVLVFAMKATHFQWLLAKSRIPPPFNGAIVDGSGTIIARTTNTAAYAGKQVRGFSEIHASRGEMDTLNVQGVRIRRFYQHLSSAGWLAVSAVEQAELHAPIRQTYWLLAAVAVALLTTAAPLAVHMTRRMKIAAQVTTDAAARLAEGELVEIQPTGVAEADAVMRILADTALRLRFQSEALRVVNAELEQRVSERTLEVAASHAFTRRILDTIPDDVTVLDEIGSLLFMNEGGRRLLMGEHGAHPSGLSWASLWPEESLSAVTSAMSQARQGEPSRFIACRSTGKAEAQWLDVLVTPMLGADGRTQQVLTISRDVTRQHEQDAELRTAKERAEAATRAKSEFLANMSHELRTPLNGILGYADLLSNDGKLAPDHRRRVHRIEDAAGALLTVVNDILDSAKIEAGEVSIHREPFSIEQVTRQACAIVAPNARKKKLFLDAQIAVDEQVWLLGDPGRLRQVLLNLLSNAVKFTQTGGIVLAVAAELESDGHRRVEICVRDTGIGIPIEEHPRLFERFSQIDSTAERPFGGTGLGLAITKHLVDRMDGQIHVESDPTGGTVFRISLPFPCADKPTVPIQAACPTFQFFDARVLVVEDVELNRDLICEMLGSLGCRTDVVETGEQAIRAVEAQVYDLVLMDEQMPGMSGSTAAQHIRSSTCAMRSVPIVACSANVLQQHTERFLAAGMDGHIGKPLTQAVLAKVLARFVRPRTLEAASAGDAPPDKIDEGLNAGVMGRARQTFKADLLKLRDAIPSSASWAGLGRLAHSMISAAWVFGLSEFAQECMEFENACLSGLAPELAWQRLKISVDDMLSMTADSGSLPAAAILQDPVEAE
jgi:PAS domain S-box-containing protein